MISLIVTLIVVGVLLWLLNNYCGAFIDGKILKIINAVVIICVVIWLLMTVFGGHIHDVPVPRL